MSRSGGVAGLRPRARETEAPPGSPAHRAATDLIDAAAPDDIGPGPTRDGFAYRVEIRDAEVVVLRATYRDPVPPALAGLLDVLDSPDAPP